VLMYPSALRLRISIKGLVIRWKCFRSRETTLTSVVASTVAARLVLLSSASSPG
jgi:hypothetical protein